MKNYFQIANSFYGEVYFRISKHLHILPSEVIKKKFTPDIRFLIMKYSQQIRNEIKEAEHIEEQRKELQSI